MGPGRLVTTPLPARGVLRVVLVTDFSVHIVWVFLATSPWVWGILWLPRQVSPNLLSLEEKISRGGGRGVWLPLVMTIPASALWRACTDVRPTVSSRNFCVTSWDTESANS